MGKARKYQSDSDSELDLKNLTIDAQPPSDSDSESEPENQGLAGMDFPVIEMDSDIDTLDGEVDDFFVGKDNHDGEEGDSEDEIYPSSDTELSEQVNSDLDIEPEYQPKNDGRPQGKLPEIEPVYDSDSSTEETTNTVGKVPMHWYDDYPHIGYTVDGKKIFKPAKGDELDKFLSTMDDPDSWKTVKDQLEQKDVRLTDEELQIIKRLTSGKFGEEDFNPYPDNVEFFSSKVRQTPLSGRMEPKSRFIPSKSENRTIMKLVKAIRAGTLVGHKPKDQAPKYFDLWAKDGEFSKLTSNYIPPPKKALPDNSESYNPPEEYLLDEEEAKAWKKQEAESRKKDYLPQKFDSLRSVPGYNRAYQESFRRCLDLYLNPRVRKNRIDIDPESLIPKLPEPKDLQPFPTRLSIVFSGHGDKVRSFDIDPSGTYLCSGSDDGTVKVWEIATGRNLQTLDLGGVVHCVAWNPNPELALVSATIDDRVVLFSPTGLCDEDAIDRTHQLIEAGFQTKQASTTENIGNWKRPSKKELAEGILVTLSHTSTVKQIVWHRKGDYFSTVSPKDGPNAIMVHQLTKHLTQRPFKKLKGAVQQVMFHPTKPLFLIATQRLVRMYNLQLQKLEKTLQPGSQWISSIDVHPQGDNVIVGSYDRRLNWFDLDLSSKPYKTLRFHKEAIRSVHYHKRYPLFASASDDGCVQLFHGMVYNDLLQNPLIVPVKILRGHQLVQKLGVLQVKFHPYQPWVVTSGADGKLCLYV